MKNKVLRIGYKVKFKNSRLPKFLGIDTFLIADWYLSGSEKKQNKKISKIKEVDPYELHCTLYGGYNWIGGHTLSKDAKLTWIYNDKTITKEDNPETWCQLNTDLNPLPINAEGEENTIEEVFTEVYNKNTEAVL